MYFHCQTNLVSTFREVYPNAFTYEGNRSILFEPEGELPEAELRHCISMALTYHLRKKKGRTPDPSVSLISNSRSQPMKVTNRRRSSPITLPSGTSRLFWTRASLPFSQASPACIRTAASPPTLGRRSAIRSSSSGEPDRRRTYLR